MNNNKVFETYKANEYLLQLIACLEKTSTQTLPQWQYCICPVPVSTIDKEKFKPYNYVKKTVSLLP